MPKKERKVVIDERFKDVLDSKSRFNMVSEVNKHGQKEKKHDSMIKDLYRIEQSDDD